MHGSPTSRVTNGPELRLRRERRLASISDGRGRLAQATLDAAGGCDTLAAAAASRLWFKLSWRDVFAVVAGLAHQRRSRPVTDGRVGPYNAPESLQSDYTVSLQSCWTDHDVIVGRLEQTAWSRAMRWDRHGSHVAEIDGCHCRTRSLDGYSRRVDTDGLGSANDPRRARVVMDCVTPSWTAWAPATGGQCGNSDRAGFCLPGVSQKTHGIQHYKGSKD